MNTIETQTGCPHQLPRNGKVCTLCGNKVTGHLRSLVMARQATEEMAAADAEWMAKRAKERASTAPAFRRPGLRTALMVAAALSTPLASGRSPR